MADDVCVHCRLAETDCSCDWKRTEPEKARIYTELTCRYVDMSRDHGAEAAIRIPDDWRDVSTSASWFDSGWIGDTLYNDYEDWVAAGGPDIIAIVDAFADAQRRPY